MRKQIHPRQVPSRKQTLNNVIRHGHISDQPTLFCDRLDGGREETSEHTRLTVPPQAAFPQALAGPRTCSAAILSRKWRSPLTVHPSTPLDP